MSLPLNPFFCQVLSSPRFSGVTPVTGLWEDTSALVTLQNVGGSEATAITATLTSSDEGELLPDRIQYLEALPPGYESSFVLTTNTKILVQTKIKVSVTSQEGLKLEKSREACNMSPESFDNLLQMFIIGQIIPIGP